MEEMSARGKLGKDAISGIPILYRSFGSKREFLEAYQRECRWVKIGVETDIQKALEEGKSVLIEGSHIDPALYLDIIQKNSIINYDKGEQEISLIGADSNLKGIVIPLIFNLAESDHRLFVENFLSSNTKEQEYSKSLGDTIESQTNTLLQNLRFIQKYLIKFSPPFEVINVNAHYFEQTLDELHARVLQNIQRAYSNGKFLSTKIKPPKDVK